ncbi:MAG TPA: hypothetical protein VE007_13840, partial [Thermoanaerobaculia bacterium]|nr:hypothetical protein [Thermoanaerobaculia bacterium]
MNVALKNPAELASRLELAAPLRLLLVDPPRPLENLARDVRGAPAETDVGESRKIRAVKGSYDAILLWREDRVGSQAVFETLLKRLEPAGVFWTVVALKKVQGVATPAAHRLELSDLVKAFSPSGLKQDREVRVT